MKIRAETKPDATREDATAFWRKALRDGALPVLALPTDRPRPRHGAPRRHAVAEGVRHVLGARRVLGDPAALAALWAVAACRHGPQEEVVVGVVVDSAAAAPGESIGGEGRPAVPVLAVPVLAVPVLLEVPRRSSWEGLLAQARARLGAARGHAAALSDGADDAFLAFLEERLTKLERDESRAAIF